MAKDYFQDIVPPQNDPPRPPKRVPVNTPPTPPPAPVIPEEPAVETNETATAPERSIRNINVPERPVRVSRPPIDGGRGPIAFGAAQLPPKPRRSPSRRWLWICAAILVIVLCGLGLFIFRKTTVTVMPRSHTVVFDQNSDFTAYATAADATGTADGLLTYTVKTSDLQDSEVVPASGTQHVETKAQGSITVYNDYSSAPVKLIKNTRFANPAGLIFRTPDDIVVPGKVGTTPGSVSVTVFADQAGSQYNIAPTSRFTVPGLQSDPAMYSNIYAQSTASTTGGFVGDQPAADPTAVQNAKADIRSRLEPNARSAAAASANSSTIVLPDLVQITYQDLPQTTEAGGGARINESAHIVIPQFDAQSFAQAIAQSVSADAQNAELSFVPQQGFSAAYASAASTTLGQSPITFALSGNAILVWQIDSGALAQALAGRSESAFNMIVSGFPSIQSARARIEPFWKSTFPTDASKINVVVTPPQSE